ncbi:MAG: glycosyltransferase [Cytophagales bacterium]
MKILHVSPSYFPALQFGGPIQSVHLLNKTLVKNGVEVDVFTTNAGLDSRNFSAKKWAYLDGVRVKYYSFWGYIHYNFSVSILIALFRNIRKYDVVHITAVWNFPVWAASFACQWHKIPYIISPRGTIYPETIAIKSSTFKKIYYQFVAKNCLEKASCIHFTALDEEIKVKTYLKLKTNSVVIANGIDLADYITNNAIENTKTHKPYILFLGRINYKKGLDILYNAFAEIRGFGIDLQLVIVGPDSDNYKSTLDKLAKSLSISEHIIYKGQMEGEAKIDMYKNAFCFVLSSYSENFGMSVVEAMASGCPVVISDKVGIFEDVLANEAGVVTKTDYQEVAKAIMELQNNISLKNKITKNGLQMVEKLYSIQGISLTFIDLYETLAQ